MGTLGSGNQVHLFLVLLALLGSAHLAAALFRRLGMPPVIGEIAAGLTIGRTCLGHLSPDVYRALFESDQPSALFLNGLYQLGVLFLMFAAGMELRHSIALRDLRTAGYIMVFGTLLPLGLSFLLLARVDTAPYQGALGTRGAFSLVFAIALAITSIPVISRIFADLGLLRSKFARIVLAAATVEDVLLYMVLSLALGAPARGAHPGAPSLLGLDPASVAGAAYHLCAATLLFVVALRGNGLARRGLALAAELGVSLPGSVLALMLVMTCAAVLTGLPAMLGSLAAGVMLGTAYEPQRGGEVVRSFGSTFFVPMYFVLVGARVDLAASFDPALFVLFLLVAAAVKLGSVYLGARLAGTTQAEALRFGVAMNARGGPCIVLASLALDAEIINEAFYAQLIMLAIVTSLAAGVWLARDGALALSAELDDAVVPPKLG